MSNTTEKKWYVVRAMGGKEKKVKEYLESEIKRLNYQDRIFNVLIPTEQYKMTYEELFKWQKTHDWTEEGFVLRYSDNFRVKMKSEDYLRVSALKANLSEKWDLQMAEERFSWRR